MRDFLFLNLRDLPYFRSLVRAVEATYYQGVELPSPTLDVGCGDGHFASLTFERAIEVGLDPWTGPLHEAGRRGCYRLLVQSEGALAPFPDGFFGSAFSNSVLEHIPDVQAVLEETARILKPGAPFMLCVPNHRFNESLSISIFLENLKLKYLANRYRTFFTRISRHRHLDRPETWQKRLAEAGFTVEKWWDYFPAKALAVLEWGHYFGLPSLIVRKLFGRWILVGSRWNLDIIYRMLQPYADATACEDGVYTFYLTRRAG